MKEITELFRFLQIEQLYCAGKRFAPQLVGLVSIKMLTALFSKSWLVKNDAPLSVKRGFRKRSLCHYWKKQASAIIL